MHLNQLETLVAVADAGSLRNAARRLGRSQPALTKTINQIEERIDAKLFQRTSRGVVLTDVGVIAVARARAVLSEMGRLIDDVNQSTGRKTGQVVIGSLPLVAALIVPTALQEFHRSWPEVQVVVQHGFRSPSLRRLREGQLDFYIGPGGNERKRGNLEIEPLFSSNMIVVCGKRNPNRKAKSLTELLNLRWIEHGAPDGENAFFVGAFDSFGFPQPTPVVKSDTIELTASILESSECFTIINQMGLDFMSRNHDLVRVPVRETLPQYLVSVVTRADTPLTPAANAFIRAIHHAATGAGISR